MSTKLALSAIRPFLPILNYLPTPVLTVVPAFILHLSTTYPAGISTFLAAPLTHPLHVPLLAFFFEVPFLYVVGLLSGNVSWVDRSWPFNTPFHSGLILLWAWRNESAGVYGHNLPRLVIMFALQLIWSIRLLSHATARGFYDFTGEDYRYTAFRQMVPRWFFNLFVHPFVIVFAQPLLLFALALPMHAVLTLPPSELSSSPFHIPFSVVMPFLPERYHTCSPSTPILGPYDFLLVAVSLVILYVEAKADADMQVFQNRKHASKQTGEIVQPSGKGSSIGGAPRPAAYPKASHPGFPTTGLWKWSRHPNFAAEQLFWLCQALFVVSAAEDGLSGVTRAGWMPGQVLGPPFALSILFKASTTLTEFLTECKYPLYSEYKYLVGQFVPQETALLWLWGTLTGSRRRGFAALRAPASKTK